MKKNNFSGSIGRDPGLSIFFYFPAVRLSVYVRVQIYVTHARNIYIIKTKKIYVYVYPNPLEHSLVSDVVHTCGEGSEHIYKIDEKNHYAKLRGFDMPKLSAQAEECDKSAWISSEESSQLSVSSGYYS
jgi:hypothetical protein